MRIKEAVEDAGLRSDVTWEDFLGDRYTLVAMRQYIQEKSGLFDQRPT